MDLNGSPLAGAEFTLTGNGLNITKTSFNDGELIFSRLPKGEYIIRETKAPTGYEKLNYQYRVIVNENGVTNVTEEPLSNEINFISKFTMPIKNFTTRSFRSNIDNQNGLRVTDYELKGAYKENGETVYVSAFEPISMKVKMTLANNKAKAGDTFDIVLDKKLQPSGFIPTVGSDAPNDFYPPVIMLNNEIVATGHYNKETNKIIYTFTDYVETHKNVSMELELNGMGPNRKLVKNNGDYTFANTIAGDERKETLNIDYKYSNVTGSGQSKWKTIYQRGSNAYPEYMNSKRFIPEWNRDIKVAKHVTYLNVDDTRGPNRPTRLTFKEIEGTNNLDIYNTEIKVYKVPNDKKKDYFVDSMDPDVTGLVEVKKDVKKVNNSIYIEFPSSRSYNGDFKDKNGYIVIANIPLKSSKEDVNISLDWDTLDDAGNTILTNLDFIHANNYVRVFGDSAGGAGEDFIDKLVPNKKDIKGKFEIEKTDQDGLVLKGAKFTLTKDDNPTVVINKTSDENGKISFDNLEEGTYTLVESEAPEGYQKSNKTWSVTVDSNGITTVIEKTPDKAMLRARGPMSYAKPINEITGQYGDLTVTTNVTDIGDDKYSVSLDFESKTQRDVEQEDIIIFVPQFEKMKDYGADNYRLAILSVLHDLRGLDQRGNIHVGIIGYSNEKNVDSYKAYNSTKTTDGLISVDDAYLFVRENKLGMFTPKEGVKDEKGLIQAFDYAVAGWIRDAYGSGTNFHGSRKNAHKTFIVLSDSNFNYYDIRQLNNSIDSAIAFAGPENASNIPEIKTILLPDANKDMWYNYFGKTDGKPEVSFTSLKERFNENQYESGMKFYGKDIEHLPLNITLNNDFDIINGPIIKFDPITGQYVEENGWRIFSSKTDLTDVASAAGWHISDYSTTPKKIELKPGELNLKAGNRANINFEVEIHDKDSITKDQSIPIMNDITFTQNGETYRIPAPRVIIPSVKTFNVSAKWAESTSKEDIKVELSNGETLTLTGPDYSVSYPENKVPLDTTITNVIVPQGHTYKIDGDNGDYTIEISRDLNYVPSIKVKNTKIDNKGKFTITKKAEGENGQEGELLPGATFELRQGDKVVATETSDNGGNISFDNLEPGTYTLVETKAPEGYEPTKDTWTVTVDVNGVTSVTHDKNEITESSLELSNISNNLMNFYNVRSRILNPTIVNEPDTNIDDTTFLNDETVGKSKVTTKATYDNTKKEYTYSLDIIAGKDEGAVGVKPKDIVVIMPSTTSYYSQTSNLGFDNFRKAVVDWLTPVKGNDSYKVSLITYAGGNAKQEIGLNSVDDFITKINNFEKINTNPNSTGVTNAFKEAATVLNGGSASDKLIVHATTTSPSTTNLTNAIKDITTTGKELTINQINLGFTNISSSYNTAFTNAKNVNKIINNSFRPNAQYPPAQSVFRNVLGDLPNSTPDVKNAKLDISFNDNFNFVTGSTSTSKKDPIPNDGGRWHAGYSNGKITLKDGELSLSAGQTAHLEFRVKASGNEPKDTLIPLINDISFTPRTGATAETISSPKVTVYDKKTMAIKNTHTGQTVAGEIITANLVRQVEGGQEQTVGTISLNLNGTTWTDPLSVKDDKGNTYTYKLKNISSSDQKIVVDTKEAEISNNQATISTYYDNNQKTITIKSEHDGSNSGTITATLRRRTGNAKAIDPDFNKNLEIPIKGSIEENVKDHAENGDTYTYFLESIDTPKDVTYITTESNDNQITIKTRDFRGFSVGVSWNGLDPIGTIKVNLSNNESVTLSPENNYFYEKAEEGINITSVEGIDGYSYIYNGVNGKFTIMVSKDEQEPNIVITNKKAAKGHFQIKKTNEDGSKVLKGAEFTLKKADENWNPINGVESIVITTDEDGYAKFDNLSAGNYVLTETKALAGY